MAALFEVGATDVADTTDDYYTPPWIFNAAGLTFDLDVCAPVNPSRRTCPARRYLTPVEDGLTQPWDGLVWMNPPFSDLRTWVERFASHRSGLAFIQVPRKRATWLGQLMKVADAVSLISVPDFGRPDGSKGEIAALMIAAGCGAVAVGAVGRVAAADKYIGGAYHVRPGGPVLT
jgi:hypothetical protein